jgi:hypothetical protein
MVISSSEKIEKCTHTNLLLKTQTVIEVLTLSLSLTCLKTVSRFAQRFRI